MSATGEQRLLGDREAGATLLEMLVVVALLGLISGLVFADLRRPYGTLSAQVGRAAVMADLRAARAQAIRTGRSTAFEVSEDGRQYSAGGRDVILPASVHVEAQPRSIVFSPDGASPGGRVVLRSSRGPALALTVSPLIGVVAEEAPHDPGA